MMRCQRLQDFAWEVRLRYFPSVFCFEADEMLRRLDAKEEFIFIDCRTEEEQLISTLATHCIVLNKDQFQERLTEFQHGPRTFLAFCTIGGRSGRFCEEYLACARRGQHAGVQMRSLLGGIAAWLHAGGCLADRAATPTRMVHPWTAAFMDLFPVVGVQLVSDELQATPADAQPYVQCWQDQASSVVTCPAQIQSKVFRASRVLASEALADTLRNAAQSASYED
jgi:rhodanese-related sulfurtransferase